MHEVQKHAAGYTSTRLGCKTKRRLQGVMAALASALVLSACGGGGEIRTSGDFVVDVVVGGQFVSETPVAPGGAINVVIRAGQSLKLDAGEPVVWTLFVGGSAVNANGVLVHYAGADIAATTLSSSAIVVDTGAEFRLQSPVPFTLVATSTYDSAQVVTANVLITN